MRPKRGGQRRLGPPESDSLSIGKTTLGSARLLLALSDATASDARLRRMWREQLIQPRIDAVAEAILRDQAAGVTVASGWVKGTAEPADTSTASCWPRTVAMSSGSLGSARMRIETCT